MTRMKNVGEKCAGPDCKRTTEKRGYCQTHYQQAYVYRIELRPVSIKIDCSAGWCSRKRASDNGHGFCNKCKARFDKYEMTFEEFISLSGECDICGSSDGWAIDHDHASGEVRGILCRNHNLGLGMIGDTLQDVKNLLTYMERR